MFSHDTPYIDNSFFYFFQKLEEELKTYLSFSRKITEQRDVFYISVPIRSGETFIDPQWHCIDKHISVDHYLPRPNDGVSDHYFSCCHATFTYGYQENDEKKGESIKRIAHAYYNRFGTVIGVNIREVFPGTEKPSRLLTMRDEWKAFLYEQASLIPGAEANVLSYPGFVVQQLLKRQQQYYCQLVQKSQDHDKTVAQLHQQWETHAFNDQDKISLMAALEEFLKMVDEINRHDRFASDKRGQLISDHLAYVRQKIGNHSFEANEKIADIESEQKFSLESPLHSLGVSVKSERKHKKKKKISSEKIETSTLTSVSFKEKSFVTPLAKIDQVLMQLKEMDPYAFRTSIFVNRNICLLKEYFSCQVRQGSLNEVSFLYPFMVNVAQSFVAKEFEKLFEDIVARNFSEEEIARWIPILEFLYNNSEYHRSLLRIFSKELRFRRESGGVSFSFSLLAGFFEKNNLPVFSMLLRLGVDPNGSESYSIIDGDRVSLIDFILSSLASGSCFPLFIDVLCDYGAFDRRSYCLESIAFVESYLQQSCATSFFRMIENTRHFFIVMTKQLHFSNFYPIGVFKKLASLTDIKTLFFSIPDLLLLCNVSFVVGSSLARLTSIRAEDELSNICLDHSSQSTAHFSVIVRPIASKRFPNRDLGCFSEIFEFLLKEIEVKFSTLTKDKQSSIVNFLMHEANQAFRREPFKGVQALNLSFTALVANNLLTDLAISDYVARFKLLLLCGQISERQEKIDINGAAYFYAKARDLIDSIPEEIRTNDAILLVKEEILIRCLLTDQKDKKLKVLLLAANCFLQEGKMPEAKRILAAIFNTTGIIELINIDEPGVREKLVVCAMRFFSEVEQEEFFRSFERSRCSK